MRISTKCYDVRKTDNHYQIMTDGVEIRMWFLTSDILRIRAGFDGDFHEGSYTLTMTAWDDQMDSFLKDYRKRVVVSPSEIIENNESMAVIQGEKLKVVIEKDVFRIMVYDAEGTMIHADIADLSWQEDSNQRRIHTSEIQKGDHFYGFGEKSGRLNKDEKFMTMSPSDAMGYNAEETDSLYKHIPFYIKLNDVNRKAVGYFYHNTAECDFNMGRRKSNYWKRHSIYRTDKGDIDLFIINGPEVRKVIERYTDLTGKSAMLPRYALGYMGSSMYYPELKKDSDDAIIEFIDTTKEEGIPVDGFQLSSGYTAQNTSEGEKRCVFTWNNERFKNPENFFEEMTKRGIGVSPNVKPGILLVHPELQKMKDNDIFVKDSKTDEPALGTWWGGKGVFADFTKPEAREYWKKMLKENVIECGTSSVWNDNCEYDSIVDKDSRVYYEGRDGKTIGEMKSVMSNLMCHITKDAIEECYNGKERPFIVCRSGHAGIQRYAQTWAGDNNTCWSTLRYNIATILGMSLSGVANQGCDIGGFYGPSPEKELFVRWIQNGIFQPRFSIHSVNTDNTVTEPWMYSDVKSIIRDAIELRYSLSPYLYSLMVRAHETGLPIMEPFCSAFQDSTSTYDEDISFMEGDSLLVANVVEKGAKTRKIMFPEGHTFYDFYTREEYEGGKEYEIPVELSSIPLFVTEDAIIPMSMDNLHNLRTEETENLHVLIGGKSASFNLREDDGITEDYLEGKCLNTRIDVKEGTITDVSFHMEGDYESALKTVTLDVIHREKSPFFVTVDGVEMKHFLHRRKFEDAESGWYYSQSRKSVLVKLPYRKEDFKVSISFEQFDMIGM